MKEWGNCCNKYFGSLLTQSLHEQRQMRDIKLWHLQTFRQSTRVEFWTFLVYSSMHYCVSLYLFWMKVTNT